MEVCKKEHKKFKKTVFHKEEKVIKNNNNNNENLPLWFDKKIEKQEDNLQELNDVTSEELERIKELINEQ